MAIEVHMGDYHRCTDCGKKWFVKLKGSRWARCNSPAGHHCPKCSAKPEPVGEHRCSGMPAGIVLKLAGWSSWTMISGDRPVAGGLKHCPYCRVALPKREG